MIGDNGDGDILLTRICSLYKLQMKAIIKDDESSYAYQVSTRASASESQTFADNTTDSSKQGEKHLIT